MNKDKSLVVYPESYVVLDIETTGFSADNDEIIELSAVKVVDNKVIAEFSQLVDPQRYLSTHIINLTGISQEMLVGMPNIKEALAEFVDFVSDNIIMGHNVTFDIGFINNKLQKHFNTTLDNDYVDTLAIARKFLPDLKSKKLGSIATYFKFNTDGMHRGLKDCVVTNMCYQKFLQMHKESQLQQVNALGLNI